MLDHPTVQIAGSKTGGGGADSLASLFGARALPGGGAAPASPAAGILESLIACCLAPKTQEDAAPAANGGATNGTAATQRGVDGNVVKNRSLPTSQLFSMLSNQTGQNVNATNFHASMTSMFGADASMKAVAVVMALMDPNFRSTLASNPMAAITSLMGGPKPAPQPGVPTSPSFNFSGLASSLLGSGTAGGKPGAAAQNGSLATLLGFGSGASSGAAMPSMPAMPTGGGGGGGLGSMLTGIMGALQQPGAGGGGMAMPQMPAPVAPTAPSQPQSAAALIFGGAQAPPATAPSGGNLFSSVFGGGNHFGMKTNPDTGVLISGCQSHETSADCMPGGDPRQAHGALSNAIQTIIRQNRQQGGAGMSFYDLVTAVRAKLATERFEQNPCLECCNTNVQKPFVC